MGHKPECKNRQCEGCGVNDEHQKEIENLKAVLKKCATYNSTEYCDICYDESRPHCSYCGACLKAEGTSVCKDSNCELAKVLGNE